MAELTSTPVPASTPRPATARPRVLHIGDPIKFNLETYAAFSAQYEIVRPSTPERQRPEFVRALREGRWGAFHAIFRPFWGSGGEMGVWDAELVDLLPPTVRVFASAGAGFDWADTKLLGEKGVVYCNSGLACSDAVADFAVAMIIATFRHLPWCIKAAESGDADEFAQCHKQATPMSHNLRGHVLGIVGFGNIGQQIAARCRLGFGMQIHYYDVMPQPDAVRARCEATVHDSLESLVRASDCVILCTPACQGAIIDASSLSWFKRGARFVNVARGSLVDEEALADALEERRVSLAALDVFAGEPMVNERLRRLAMVGRVMLTCHNAGGTVETHKGFEELSMRNIMAVLSDGRALTPVNIEFVKGM